MHVGLQSKYTLFLSDIMGALFFQQIFGKYIPNFMKLRRMGAELFPCGRTGRRTDFFFYLSECKHPYMSHNADGRIIACTDDVHLELMCEECLFRTLTAFPSQHHTRERQQTRKQFCGFHEKRMFQDCKLPKRSSKFVRILSRSYPFVTFVFSNRW
jgi:hypothetical protein